MIFEYWFEEFANLVGASEDEHLAPFLFRVAYEGKVHVEATVNKIDPEPSRRTLALWKHSMRTHLFAPVLMSLPALFNGAFLKTEVTALSRSSRPGASFQSFS